MWMHAFIAENLYKKIWQISQSQGVEGEDSRGKEKRKKQDRWKSETWQKQIDGKAKGT